MLLEIREKVHGVFASVVLVLICVLFGLWGIQNYLGGGKETPVITVGDKEFFENDVNKAYQQFAQSLAGIKVDEETIRKQALSQLVRDEVLLQYVQKENLLVTDDTAKEFIKTLEYFQKDGKFDKAQYQALLGAQGISSEEFILRIKKALIMQQFQRAITDSSFVTPAEISNFFKIQNQKRDLEYVTVALTPVTDKPSDEEITAYFQQHQDAYQSEEQIAVDYVELSLDKLAEQIKPADEQLKAYYEEQKAAFSTKERRKVSHILFAFSKDVNDEQALQKAIKAKQELKAKDFALLAAEVSDDKASAKNGGDLGLFNAGVFEKSFEDTALSLKQGEVSEPIKSAFGYHLIKVTELVPGEVKPYEAVKAEVSKAYQKTQAEAKFTSLGEKLTEVSYENPDTLEPSAKLLDESVKNTGLFTHNKGEGIAAEEKIRLAAFSEDVQKGNNSEPLEIGADKIVVLRMREHLPAATKELKDVKAQVITALQHDKAVQKTTAIAEQLKAELLAGKALAQLAEANHLPLKKVQGLSRVSADVSPLVSQAVFKAAKPQAGHPGVVIIDDAQGGKVVANIVKVTEGELTEANKAQQGLIAKNIAGVLGKAEFESVLNSLQARADITIHEKKQ